MVQYRRWAPSQSPLRVEFPLGLLRELQTVTPGQQMERTGVLFGTRYGWDVRIMAVSNDDAAGDSQCAGLRPVGIFAARARGEVFLTESNLESFDRAKAAVALVLAGPKGGFFVRNSDGSVQSIQSFEEFSVGELNSPLAELVLRPTARVKAQKPAKPRRARRQIRTALACLGLIAIPLMAAPLWKPLLPRPRLALSVLESDGQLRITWNPRAIRGQATLEIVDGAENTVRPVDPVQTSAVYARRSGQVEVRLAEIDESGVHRNETVRFVGRAIQPAKTDRSTRR